MTNVSTVPTQVPDRRAPVSDIDPYSDAALTGARRGASRQLPESSAQIEIAICLPALASLMCHQGRHRHGLQHGARDAAEQAFL